MRDDGHRLNVAGPGDTTHDNAYMLNELLKRLQDSCSDGFDSRELVKSETAEGTTACYSRKQLWRLALEPRMPGVGHAGQVPLVHAGEGQAVQVGADQVLATGWTAHVAGHHA